MRLYRRGKVWWLADGDFRESTRCTSKDAAVLYLRRRERELADPHHAAKDAATLDDAVTTFLDTLDRAKAPEGTKDMYRTKTGHLLRLLPPRLSDVTVASVETYFETRDEEGAAPSTLYKEWVALSRTLKLAAKKDLFGEVKKLKPDWVTATSVARTTFLVHEEISRLLRELAPERREVVAFIIASGARWSEAMRFQPRDLERTTWHLRIRGTKTDGADRTIVVPDMYRGLLDLVEGPFEPWPNVRRDLHVAARKADRTHARELPEDASHCPLLPALSPNDLRRTFATLLVQAGVPLDVVAKLLGHTTTAMVYKVYGQFTPATLANLASGGVRVLYGTPKNPVENTDNLDGVSGPQELTKCLKNRPFAVGRVGHDPTTDGLKVRCSTD